MRKRGGMNEFRGRDNRGLPHDANEAIRQVLTNSSTDLNIYLKFIGDNYNFTMSKENAEDIIKKTKERFIDKEVYEKFIGQPGIQEYNELMKKP